MAALIIGLLVLGFLLLFLETLVPGGVIGLLGIAALIAGVALSFREYGASTGATVFAVTAIAVLIVFLVGLKVLPRTPFGRRILLSQNVESAPFDAKTEQERRRLIGRTGTAQTDLRPSGRALIDGKRWDVVTEGAYTSRDTPVRVIDVVGTRIVVAVVAANESASESAEPGAGDRGREPRDKWRKDVL